MTPSRQRVDEKPISADDARRIAALFRIVGAATPVRIRHGLLEVDELCVGRSIGSAPPSCRPFRRRPRVPVVPGFGQGAEGRPPPTSFDSKTSPPAA